jgi:hypothetical protein
VSGAEYDLDVLSLGAGVQSSAMLLQAHAGLLEHGSNLIAMWADVQAEPPWVYEQLDYLESIVGKEIPLHRVTAGSLEKNIYVGGQGRAGFAQIPTFLDGERGRGIGRRQCTSAFKVNPIQKACRELLGLKPRQRAAGRYRVRHWIGISTDEAHRAKPSPVSWIERHYPLLFERPQNRGELLAWMAANGHPEPSPSSCYFCPFHSDREWLALKDREPALFARAVQIDSDLRTGKVGMGKNFRGEQYLHNSLLPLDQVEFRGQNQAGFHFGEECEGACGV